MKSIPSATRGLKDIYNFGASSDSDSRSTRENDPLRVFPATETRLATEHCNRTRQRNYTISNSRWLYLFRLVSIRLNVDISTTIYERPQASILQSLIYEGVVDSCKERQTYHYYLEKMYVIFLSYAHTFVCR